MYDGGMTDALFRLMAADALETEPNPFDPTTLPPSPHEDGAAGILLQFDPNDDGIPRCADCSLEILDDEWVDIDDPADGSKRRVHSGCAPAIHLPPADVPPPRPRRRR